MDPWTDAGRSAAGARMSPSVLREVPLTPALPFVWRNTDPLPTLWRDFGM